MTTKESAIILQLREALQEIQVHSAQPIVDRIAEKALADTAVLAVSPQPAPGPMLSAPENRYKEITAIIFERYPRIKGAFCASIAYGIIAYIEADLRAALAAPATVDRNAVLEEAAAACEQEDIAPTDNLNGAQECIAASIRALKSAAPASVPHLSDIEHPMQHAYPDEPQPAVPEGRPIYFIRNKGFSDGWTECSSKESHDGCIALGAYDSRILYTAPEVAQPAAQGDARDADRWRALLNSPRIRMLGSAGLNRPEPNNYAHFGMEIWSRYGRDYKPELLEEMDRGNALGKEWLIKYADIAIEAQRTAPPQSTDKPAEGKS
jgi:hypothetical protein